MKYPKELNLHYIFHFKYKSRIEVTELEVRPFCLVYMYDYFVIDVRM